MDSIKQLSNSERLKRNQMFRKNMVWCSGCKDFNSIEKVWRSKSQKNYGYRFYCKKCEKSRRNANSQRANQRNKSLVSFWVDLAGGECQRCSYSEFNSGLSFHHVNPELKQHNPTSLIMNNGGRKQSKHSAFQKTYEELDKCVLLCLNCHISYEASNWFGVFRKSSGLGYELVRECSEDEQIIPKHIPSKCPDQLLPDEQLSFFA